MHRIISTYASVDKGLSIPDWSRYVATLELRTSIYQTRFLQGPFFYSPFCNMVKQILMDIPWGDIDKCTSDYARYKIITEAEGSCRALVDPIYMSRDTPNIFTYGKTPDFVLRVSSKYPMSTLPLNAPWKIIDQDVQPVRILYHNALELVTDLQRFSVRFKGPAATYLVCSVDLIALMFKYVRYRIHCAEVNDDSSVEAFLQSHIVPVWFEDLRRIWLFNILSTMLFEEFDITKCTMDQTISPNNLLLGVQSDVQRIKSQLQHQVLALGNILATEWFDAHSIKDWLSVLEMDMQVPTLQQYTYLRFISDYPYIKFAVKVNNLCNHPTSATCNRELFQLLQKYITGNVFASFKNSAMRNALELEVSKLCSEIKMR